MSTEHEKERVERVAKEYHSSELAGVNEMYHIYVRNRVISESGGKNALEIGCGKGLWTSVLCDRYDEVDIVDASDELLHRIVEENQNKRAKINIHHALIEEFNPPHDKKWDHVYLTFLLEHLVDPVSVLMEIRRYLSPHGIIFVAVPNANSVHRILAVRMGLIRSTTELSKNDEKMGHRRVYTLEMLKDQVREAGFKIINEWNLGLKPLSIKQMEGWSKDLLWALCDSGDLCKGCGAYIALSATHAG